MDKMVIYGLVLLHVAIDLCHFLSSGVVTLHSLSNGTSLR
jgi:hypothetical protein